MAITTDQKNKLNRMCPAAKVVNLGSIVNVVSGIPTLVASVVAEVSNYIDVTCQAKDPDGANLAGYRTMLFYVSDAIGGGITASPPTSVSAQTGNMLAAFVGEGAYTYVLEAPNVFGWAISNANGTLVLRVTESGAKTLYVNFIDATGAITTATLTFA